MTTKFQIFQQNCRLKNGLGKSVDKTMSIFYFYKVFGKKVSIKLKCTYADVR
jgi:hypothetical protein